MDFLESVKDFLCMCVRSHSVVSDALRHCGLQPTRLLSPRHSPGKNIRVGSHFLLQGIFPPPGIKPTSPALAREPLGSQKFLINDSKSTILKKIKLIDWTASKLIILVFQMLSLILKYKATDRRKYLINTLLINDFYPKCIDSQMPQWWRGYEATQAFIFTD